MRVKSSGSTESATISNAFCLGSIFSMNHVALSWKFPQADHA